MRVGIIQSNYIPWRGYFDFIDNVDLFICHDDLQYTKGDWRNRNKIKTNKGLSWLTVPVSYRTVSQLICDTYIDNSQKWQKSHLNKFRSNYMNAPFFQEAIAILEAGITSDYLTISELNINLIKLICKFLNIITPLAISTDYEITGTKNERLINLLQKVGANVYLSGPTAQAYLDEKLFHLNGINLEYKTYDYEPYPQLWGEFVGNVSVLDLIANTGKNARHFLKSRTPNIVVV